MEAPLHQLSLPLPPPPQEQDTAAVGAALLRQAAAARAIMMAATATSSQHLQQPPAPAMGREQCPRCASRDTKFCYYNNYNTAQPRHFCRACRRYWTLGGSLRNVPVGGSIRKRPRPARPTRAAAATASGSGSGGGPFATAAAAPPPPPSLLGSLLLGGCSSAAASPLLALGAVPLLEGRLGLGQPSALLLGGGAAGDVAHQLGFGGAGPMLWPAAAAATVLEGDRAFPLPLQPAAALWQELAAAAAPPAVEAGAGLLQHGGSAPHLLM